MRENIAMSTLASSLTGRPPVGCVTLRYPTSMIINQSSRSDILTLAVHWKGWLLFRLLYVECSGRTHRCHIQVTHVTSGGGGGGGPLRASVESRTNLPFPLGALCVRMNISSLDSHVW